MMRARVRGMGVADMGQGRPLLHAEAVLFIGDDQGKGGKGHVLGEEGVGADEQVHLSGGEGLLQGPLLGGRGGAGEQPDPYPQRLQEGGEGVEMLVGQQLGGGHHSGLTVVLGDGVGTGGGHHCFARAHIPLDQPVHGKGAAKVPHGVVNGPPLGLGQLEGQRPKKGLQGNGGEGKGGRLPLSLCQEGHPQGEGKQLVEDQPPPGNLRRRRVGRPMDGRKGVGEGTELLPPAQAGGQGVLRLLGQGKDPGHMAGDHLGGEPGGQRIDGHQLLAAVQGKHLGGVHLPPQKGSPHPAVKQIGLLQLQALGGVAGIEKSEQEDRTGLVHHGEFEEG